MPSIGLSDTDLNELKKGSVFDGFSLIKTRYFCMFFCIVFSGLSKMPTFFFYEAI
jgi:hypothetical protein